MSIALNICPQYKTKTELNSYIESAQIGVKSLGSNRIVRTQKNQPTANKATKDTIKWKTERDFEKNLDFYVRFPTIFQRKDSKATIIHINLIFVGVEYSVVIKLKYSDGHTCNFCRVIVNVVNLFPRMFSNF